MCLLFHPPLPFRRARTDLPELILLLVFSSLVLAEHFFSLYSQDKLGEVYQKHGFSGTREMSAFVTTIHVD